MTVTTPDPADELEAVARRLMRASAGRDYGPEAAMDAQRVRWAARLIRQIRPPVAPPAPEPEADR